MTTKIHAVVGSIRPPMPGLEGEGARFRDRAGATGALTPREAASELAQAWRRLEGDSPSSATLSILWAQWALETGRGRHMQGHNFAGLKVTDESQAGATLMTTEGYGAQARRVSSRFRAYATVAEGADDYLGTLRARYPEAFQAAARGDSAGFVDGLAMRRYFTGDPAAYQHGVRQLAAEFCAGEGPIVNAPPFLVEGVIRAFGRALSRD